MSNVQVKISELPVASNVSSNDIFAIVQNSITKQISYANVSSSIVANVVSQVHSVPSGGDTNQVLTKASETDYDLIWSNVSSGTTDHSLLTNLDYNNSGHTGFQASGNYLEIGGNVSSLVNDVPYLITETDPIFTSSNAFNITANDLINIQNLPVDLSPYALESDLQDTNNVVSNVVADVLNLQLNKADKTITINGYDLSNNISLTTNYINDYTNKRYVTDSDLLVLANTSGVNTGDQVIYDSIGMTIDGGTSAITTGLKGYVVSPYDANTVSWNIVGDVSGDIVIDIWKKANAIPTVTDTITSNNKPTIVSSQLASGNCNGWITSINENDVIGYNIDSVSTFKKITLTIKVEK